MSWVKLDDQFMRHPKIIAAGRDARDLYLAGLCYCAETNRDGGFVPLGMIAQIGVWAGVSNPFTHAKTLVATALWIEDADGYCIFDWLRCSFTPKPDNQSDRHLPEYERWRAAVLTRDDFCCQSCGAVDVPLHAHHLRHWAHFPDERFEISNGLTLCVPCHQAIHAKGGQ